MGKPVFTILFSPVAQFGFKAVNVLNMVFVFWGAWLSYLIGRNLLLKYARGLPLIVLSTPIVAGNAISGLTEPVCAMFLIVYLYFATKERWVTGSLPRFSFPF